MAGIPMLQFEIESEVIAYYGKLIRGDQIAVVGTLMREEYYHHGIYLGNGKVADFGGDSKKGAKPRKVDIQDFTDNGKRKLVRINYTGGDWLSPEQAATNAEEFVANPDRWGSYDLLRNNCEHFATRCKTGIATSGQVYEKVIDCILNPEKVIKCALALANAVSKSASGFTS